MRIGIVASSVQVQESGGDVTPDSVNWENITTFGLPSWEYDPVGGISTGTISGITTSIILEITFTAGVSIGYRKNSGDWTPVSSGGTFTASNADIIDFQMVSGTANETYTVTVKNASDGNVTLDTFTCRWFDV